MIKDQLSYDKFSPSSKDGMSIFDSISGAWDDGVTVEEETKRIRAARTNLKRIFPEDLMQQVAEYAINEYEAGRCIPNSQVKDKVMERLGWK